jgi:oxygen-independent coproporphyrinogen III oxidase
VDAICKEIYQVSRSAPRRLPVHTVFFGGGTPSLLGVEHFAAILKAIRESFDLREDAEMTLEANPGTVSLAYLQELRRLGMNRLSFGMQSAHPDDLRLLERQHDFFDLIHAALWARQAGFDNLSLDLIFALPEQSMERWQATLAAALDLNPEHLSLYALIIEHGTPLHRLWSHGRIPLIDDDLAADMYEYAMDFLAEAGFHQYEISNWAKTGKDGQLLVSRHNSQYWYNRPYLGFGSGAHGFSDGRRTMNVGGIGPFIERCQQEKELVFPAGPAVRRVIEIDRRTEMEETMMVGLRLTLEGVSADDFSARFGCSLQDVFGTQIDQLTRAGLLEWTGGSDPHLRLTRRGRLLGNQVFMQFVGG